VSAGNESVFSSGSTVSKGCDMVSTAGISVSAVLAQIGFPVAGTLSVEKLNELNGEEEPAKFANPGDALPR
jgi:hypothetical protein